MYENGRGFAKDLGKAVEYYKRALKLGNPIAANNLGNLYLMGNGVPLDHKEGVRLIQLAAEQGYSTAQHNIAGILDKGKFGVPVDLAASASWYKKAADNGVLQAAYEYGAKCHDGDGIKVNIPEALKYFEIAGEGGNAAALFNLAVMHTTGEGCKADEAVGLKYFQLAADNGDSTAQYNMGVNYLEGDGVPVNIQLAIHYFTLAAKQGDRNAILYLKKMMRF